MRGGSILTKGPQNVVTLGPQGAPYLYDFGAPFSHDTGLGTIQERGAEDARCRYTNYFHLTQAINHHTLKLGKGGRGRD